MKAAMEDIVLQYTYPRLDAEVSKHRNHLLKAPFCVHPKTGRICVPVDPERIDDFDPGRVPTVGQLLRELDAASTESNGEEHSGIMYSSLVSVGIDARLFCVFFRLGEDISEALCRYVRKTHFWINGGSAKG